MGVHLYAPHLPDWHAHLPDWHPHWPEGLLRGSVSHWPHVPWRKPSSGAELAFLHGCLVLANMIWSSLHILMAVPLRKVRQSLVRRSCGRS